MRHPNCPDCVQGQLAALRWYPYQRLHRYPHLLAADKELWTELVAGSPDWALACCYDAHLGAAWPQPTGGPEIDRRILEGLTRYRCDVIAAREDEILCCEIKPAAGLGALGQALGYATLLATYDPQPVSIIPTLICGWPHPALLDAANELGVRVYCQGP